MVESGAALFRFLTNPDNVGVEKVAATQVPDAYLEKPYSECAALEGKGIMADVLFSINMCHLRRIESANQNFDGLVSIVCF